MDTDDARTHDPGTEGGWEADRPPGVTVIPDTLERRLYFLAFLVLSGWFLLDRLF